MAVTVAPFLANANANNQESFQVESLPPPVGFELAKPTILSVLLILFGVGFIEASVGGLLLFIQADYFTDPGPYPPNSWHGYDARTFVGLVLFTLAPTLGFVLVYVGLQTLGKLHPHPLAVGTFALFGIAATVTGVLGMVWGWETMKCLGAFCIGTKTYVEIPNARPEAGLGWKSMVGMGAFFSLVPVGLLTILAAVKLHRRAPLPEIQGLKNLKGTSDLVVGVIGFASVFCFAIVTFYFPNSFESYVAARVAKAAAIRVSSDASVCNAQWQSYTCPEVGWAWMRTSNLRLSEQWILKLFPSNLVFFIYLLGMILFVYVVRFTKGGRHLLKRNITLVPSSSGFLTFGSMKVDMNFTVGEILTLLATTMMIGAFFFYWAHDHNYNGYWTGGDNPGVSWAERWARTLGQLAVVFMSLLFFPASRYSVVHQFFGSSWEASLWFHRWLGYGMLLASAAHMVLWYIRYAQVGLFPRDIFDVPMSLPTSIDNFTVPLNTITTWTLLVCMGLLALNPVRRRFFEVFYYAHLFAASIAIPAVMYHAAASWEYLMPGLTVWFIDRMIRLNRSADLVQIISVKVYEDVTEIKFLKPNMSVTPGQYVFVNIPQVSVLQWHPFTISSGAPSPFLSLHIKSMGPQTWTDDLNKLATRMSGQSQVDWLSLSVDGPYGTPLDYADFSRVVLIGGGIGVTPCASIYTSLKGQCRADFIWSLREASLMKAFLPALSSSGGCSPSEETRAQPMLDCGSSATIFLTRGSQEKPSQSDGVQIISGSRPNLEEILQRVAGETAPSDVMVFVCGPEPLVEDALSVSRRLGLHFHRETFLL